MTKEGVRSSREPTRPGLVDPTWSRREYPTIRGASYVRLPSFLERRFAEEAYREARDDIDYEREDIAGMTRAWRARVGAEGEIAPRVAGADFAALNSVCDLLVDPWFEWLMGRVTGEPVRLADTLEFKRLGRGDRIMVHEDVHLDRLRYGVVLYLTKGWRREFGGNFIIGPVARRESLGRSEGFPHELIRRYLRSDRSILTPRFNTLSVFRLTGSIAHGVTPIHVARWRYAMVSLFGYPDEATYRSLREHCMGYDFPSYVPPVANSPAKA